MHACGAMTAVILTDRLCGRVALWWPPLVVRWGRGRLHLSAAHALLRHLSCLSCRRGLLRSAFCLQTCKDPEAAAALREARLACMPRMVAELEQWIQRRSKKKAVRR